MSLKFQEYAWYLKMVQKKDNPESYRPISIIPVVLKSFELIIVLDELGTIFEQSNILNPFLCGFRIGKSTADATDKMVH